jgi:P4 family phage/plasmid primase-like protien
MNDIERAARSWHAAGASVLPAVHGKMPAVSWTEHQTERADPSQWNWADYPGFGIVTGYGGFEMFELEKAAIDKGLLGPLLERIGGPLAIKIMTYMEQSPKGGYHFVYRVDPLEQEHSTKLARQADHLTLIETRGRFGWTVMAPSTGAVHDEVDTGWTVMVGTPGEVPTLTPEEHEALFEAARSLDELPPPDPIEHREAITTSGDELAPGQDFEQRSDWMADILGPLGWTVVQHVGEKTIIRRPGKRVGKSATLNYDGNDNLFVFTSSTEFPEYSSWTKFGAYTFLEHGGDYAAAARALRARGFGSPPKIERKLTLIPGIPDTDGNAALEPWNIPSPEVPVTLTDDGNALLLVAAVEGKLLYSPDRGSWLAWRGHRWEWVPDASPAYEVMRELVRRLEPVDKAEITWKIKSLSRKSIDNAVFLAARDPKIHVTIDSLDADPMVLNTPAGTINLLTGELSPPSPAGRHTRITGVGPDFEQECPRWMRFLAETFAGDPALIGFIQRVMGYSATGAITHQILPFCHGDGGNGKSVFLEVAQALLGDYAGTAPADFLLASGKDETYATADLVGKRLVVCSEVPPTARFHEQKVKQLTGGDRITARFMRQNYFTFRPSHHLWLLGNHEPRVEAGGESFWRRMRKIPFIHTVPEDKKIPDLAERLVAEEGPAILAWIIAGARDQVGGLNEPDTVLAATMAYAKEEDQIGRFIADRVIIGGDPKLVRLRTTAVYEAYQSWARTQGEPTLTAGPFGKALKAHGIASLQSNSKNWYLSVTLRNGDEEDDAVSEQMRY